MIALFFYIGLSAPLILSIVTFLKTSSRWDRVTNWIFLLSGLVTAFGIAFGFFGSATTLLLLSIISERSGIPDNDTILGIGIFSTWTSLYPLAKILSVKITTMRVQGPIGNSLYTLVYFYGLQVISSAVGIFFFYR